MQTRKIECYLGALDLSEIAASLTINPEYFDLYNHNRAVLSFKRVRRETGLGFMDKVSEFAHANGRGGIAMPFYYFEWGMKTPFFISEIWDSGFEMYNAWDTWAAYSGNATFLGQSREDVEISFEFTWRNDA